jgi:hypothetical protein
MPSDRHRWNAVRRQLGKVLDHPRTSLAVGVLGVAATVATFVLADAGTSAKRPGLSKSPSPLTSPGRQSSRTPIPLLSGDASCNDLRQSASQTRGTRLFIDSPGQIGGGTGALRARLLPNGGFLPLISVSVGNEVEVSARLHNPDYSSAEGVSVSASISANREACWRVVATVGVKSFPVGRSQLGPALIRLQGLGRATLEYVAGSTALLDEQGHTLVASLPDGITTGGVALPYAVPGGTAYFLSFRVRVKPR